MQLLTAKAVPIMLNDFTLGQYFPTNSLIHRLDPRIKLLLTLGFLILIFCATNIYALTLIIFFVVCLIFLTKIPLKMYVKNLKFILPILIFTTVINLFYTNNGNIILEFWKIKITDYAVVRSIFLSLRIVLLIIISSALTYTTSPNSITTGLESLFSPFKYIGLGRAVHTMTMMMTIALRFIPTLVEETQKIMNAQKARGVNFENGSLIQRIKAIIPILIPLLISSVKSAYDLAEAMESRCYNGGENKTNLKVLKMQKSDYLAVLFFIICCLIVFLFNIVF